MILFESESIYYLDGPVLGIRRGNVAYDEAEPLEAPEDAHRPLYVAGTKGTDLGMLMCIGTAEGVSKVPYLITEDDVFASQIVPCDMVIQDQQRYINEQLARRLQNLNRGGLATFGLECIMAEINRRYPRA